jgi:predicted DNA-binding mobile mystery protein A
MKKSQLAARARQSLDSRFETIPPAATLTPPIRGWIRAIREALGMTSAQLAKRLKVSQPAIATIEQSEAKGTIQLATLRRVAAAMNCTLAYTLVPNKSLETTVRDQARKVARRRLQSVDHTMLLENQQSKSSALEAQIDAYVRDMDLRALWDET